MYFFTKQKMKFCKRCHKRVVEKIDSTIDFSVGSVKICTCTGPILNLKGAVINRLVSEVGVSKVKKTMVVLKILKLIKFLTHTRKEFFILLL